MTFQKTRFHRALLNWYAGHRRDLPWRRTRDPYAILLSEFMLQQTQVATVIPYYDKWLRRFPDFASLARASGNDVLHSWQGLGYYNRARNLHAVAKILQSGHRGIFPKEIAAMRKLPGIGRYTANAVATFAFDQSVPIVEANVARVLARVFDIGDRIDSASGRDQIWKCAAELVPRHGPAHFNSALIDLGALVCLPRVPKCNICPVRKFCRAKKPAGLPLKKSKPRTKRSIERHAFVLSRGRILLEQSLTRWRGMWILPALKPGRFKRSSFRRDTVYRSVFPFTRHRILLAVYRCGAPRRLAPHHRWFESIDHIAMPSPHRRAAQLLLFSAMHRRESEKRSLSESRFSQRNKSSSATPAAVVKIVTGIPKRA